MYSFQQLIKLYIGHFFATLCDLLPTTFAAASRFRVLFSAAVHPAYYHFTAEPLAVVLMVFLCRFHLQLVFLLHLMPLLLLLLLLLVMIPAT